MQRRTLGGVDSASQVKNNVVYGELIDIPFIRWLLIAFCRRPCIWYWAKLWRGKIRTFNLIFGTVKMNSFPADK